MTLRTRLMLIIGLSFTLLWSATTLWMFLDVRVRFREALDERLAASARMVASLVREMPEVPPPSSGPQTVLDVVAKDGVACEIRLLRGNLVARTHNSPPGLGATATGFHTRTIQGERWRSYTFEQDGKRVTTADKVGKRLELLRNIVTATVVPFLVAMLGSLVVLWFGIRRGLAPLEAIREALARRRPGATETLPDASVPPELAPLVQTINGLLHRMQSAIERERRFTGDAAHELRTPLTAVKTHIQVARLTKGEETLTSLAHAEEGVQRLQHTIEQLLMLARVEGPFSFEGERPANAAALARAAVREIPPALRERIVVDDAAGEQQVAVPPVLAVTALRNLLDNALRYSPPDTLVTLRLVFLHGTVRFSVLDQGPGIGADDYAHAMQRFWRKGTGHGSGLGLSIVEAIVKRFGGTLRFSRPPQGGIAAEIDFPAASSETCLSPGDQAASGS